MMQSETLIRKATLALDQIRPYLVADHGDVEIVEITDDKKLIIRLLGSCSACPMSLMTLKAGIEETILREVPEILTVEAIGINNETVAA